MVLHRSDLIRDTKRYLLGRDCITRDLASIIRRNKFIFLDTRKRKALPKKVFFQGFVERKDKESMSKNHRGDKDLKIMQAS